MANRRSIEKRRAFLAVVAVSGLGAVWAGLGGGGHSMPAGTAAVSAHFYVAQPGDTLWGIAEKVDPAKDPRQLVQQLSQELHGATLQAGQQVQIP